MSSVLCVEDLTVILPSQDNAQRPVEKVSFSISPGSVFSLVGESGCGKSMTALAISRLLPTGCAFGDSSRIYIDGEEITSMPECKVRKIRQQKIGFIFQDPMSSLNPVLTVYQQLQEATRHKSKRSHYIEALERVQLPRPEQILKSYPHQLSGGMKQRVMIAMALLKNPTLLIADEPTTALDVTTQKQIIDILNEIKTHLNTAILFITHDLALVNDLSDEVAIMYAGQIVEKSPTKQFFQNPAHPYSQMLLNSLPEKSPPKQMIPIIKGMVPPVGTPYEGCRLYGRCPIQRPHCQSQIPAFYPNDPHAVRCHLYPNENKLSIEVPEYPVAHFDPHQDESEALIKVTDLKVHYGTAGWFNNTPAFKAVDGVSFSVHEDETVALVGQSGSGKTTVGKAVMRLLDVTAGKIEFMGRRIDNMPERRVRIGRDHFQMIFQDPMSSLNPKLKILDILQEGMVSLKIGSNKSERKDRVINLLEQVGLDASAKDKFPHQFSGGQKQRICIARALSVAPRFIVCDEPTSALDVSVQAQILNLLQTLQNEYGIGYLFITHNINVVRHFADRICVMKDGIFVEYGKTKDVLDNPQHEYTRSLIEAVPQF